MCNLRNKWAKIRKIKGARKTRGLGRKRGEGSDEMFAEMEKDVTGIIPLL